MRCSKCGADNREGRKFCTQCGSALAAKCPRCGAAIEPAEKFCGECGAALGRPSAAIGKSDEPQIEIAGTPASEKLEGERKTVTALFADIKGSMELIEDLDPEEARAIVDPALKLMMESVERYGGYVAQSTGDGIFALFGAPVAHEDHPQRALFAALRMQAEVKRYADKLRAEKGVSLQVRVGANTGEVVVREIRTGEQHTEYLPIGHSTSVAARLQALAAPGSIAIPESVRKLIEGYFAIKSLGPARIKGVSEPLEIYEVTGLGPLRTRLQRAAARGYTRFVGRQREMDAMKHAADLAQSGHGQVVAAVAEPGVGKSRLFFEFKAGHQSDWMVLEAFSVSHGKASAYFPVIDLLNGYFAIEAGDDARKRREQVTGKLLTLDRSLEDGMSYLLGLLSITEGEDGLAGMDAQVRKRRTLEAIKRMLLRESLNQPLMIIFEDLHWIDEGTQAFLNLLADSIGTARILLLVNYRPEYRHDWSGKTYYTQLRLDPLGEEGAQEMLAALLGDDRTLAPVRRLILERAEGNPFFIEEMFQTLFEEGVLASNGTIRLAKPLSEVKVPATVQGVLASRIDRLSQSEKELLQTLSVIGRQFPLSLVKQVVDGPEDEVQQMLTKLQLAEFIYEQPAIGDIEYTFKHALTQEVAHNSLLSDRRKSLHERVGMSIEASFSASLADHYDELAHQFRSSGNAGKALEYLVLAGQQAMLRTAFAEAQEQFGAALTSLTALPATIERDRTESIVRLKLGICTIFRDVGSFMSDAVLSSVERANELCEKLGSDSHHCDVLSALAFLYSNRFEYEKMRTACDKLLALASDLNDTEMIGRAHFWSAFTPMWQGNFRAALEAFERAYSLPPGPISFRARQELSFGKWKPLTRSVSALALAIMGFPEKARARNREAIALAREDNDRSVLIPILFWSTVLHLLLREPDRAHRSVEEGLRVAHAENLSALLGVNEFFHGRALVQLGEIDRGLDQIARTAAEITAFAQTPVGTLIYPALAEAYLTAGRRSEAIQAVSRGIAILEQNQARFAEPELHRLNGQLMLLAGNAFSEPENSFRKAIEIARSQGAKWYELRATNELARLLMQRNRRNDARAMLGEIYSWFTEGFGSADLKDAKALLEELAHPLKVDGK
jgi:class 3 adenylate cyclase/tetratricopeptide (TPR) repeat protein